MYYSGITGNVCTQVRNENIYFSSDVYLPIVPISPRNDTSIPCSASTLTADEFPSPISYFSLSLLGDQTYLLEDLLKSPTAPIQRTSTPPLFSSIFIARPPLISPSILQIPHWILPSIVEVPHLRYPPAF